MLSCIYHLSTGVLLLGGETSDGDSTNDGDSTKELKTDEIFPSQARVLKNFCNIPDLAQGRHGHTLSILPSGLFVVCGGDGPLDTCLILTNYGPDNVSWVLHKKKMRFASDDTIP